MFWELLCIAALLLIIWELQHRWKNRSILKLPGAFEIPIIGSAPFVLSKMENLNNEFANIVKNYGPIARYSILHEMFIVIADPEMLEFVLRSPSTMAKGNLYNYMKRWLGEGILLTTGPRYHDIRKGFLIGASYLQETLEEFEHHSKILIDVLNKKIDNNKPLDVYPLIVNYTLDIASDLITGESLNVQSTQQTGYCEAMEFMSSLIIRRAISSWSRFDFLYKFSPLYKEETKKLKIIDDVALQAMEKRKNDLSTPADRNNKKRKLPLDIIFNIANNNILSHDMVKTETNGIMWVGHDSTATTIAVMIHHLANNKDIQDKIVEELKFIFEDDRDRPVTMQDLSEMKYTERVMKEILRFYPILPLIFRTATEDIEYKGIHIPKGTQLCLNIYGIHRSNQFEKPDEFNPDRFLPGYPITPYSYIPFSGGTRSCLGQRYSMYKTKTTIAKLLRHFEFEPAGPQYKLQFSSKLVSKPVNGMYVQIKPRNF